MIADTFLMIAITMLVIFGAVEYFGPQYERALARNQRSAALSAADRFWRDTYMSPMLESECIDASLLDANMLIFYGDPCDTTPPPPAPSVPGFRVHQVIDCTSAHVDMRASGERTELLLDDEWRLVLREGRMSGELIHRATELRFDYRRPDEAEGFGEVLRDEVNFPEQRAGELFANQLSGETGSEIYRPQPNCLNTL